MRPAHLVLLLPAVFLSSCVSYYRLPEGYSGPTATIENSGSKHDAFKASTFELIEINGKPVRSTTIQTPPGAGPVVQVGGSWVKVPAGQPISLKIAGRDRFAADGPALLYSLGGNVSKSASETLSFTPEAGHAYVVRGELGETASSVWLEDFHTRRRWP